MTLANNSTETPATPAQRATDQKSLILERIIDAPRDLVFKAWTDPQQMAQWWGPKYFTNPVCELDARPGGAILIHMRGPDGAIYPMEGEFVEVIPPERLVMTSRAFGAEDGPFLLEEITTVTFEEQGGKTKLTVHAAITRATAEAAGALAGMEEGWNQSLDRLADYVTQH